MDTSRAIQQEKQLKKLLKSLEDEKLNQPTTSLNVPQVVTTQVALSQSQPTSPSLRINASNSPGGIINSPKQDTLNIEEQRKKQKSKSFKGFASFRSRASSKENRDQVETNTKSTGHLGLPPPAATTSNTQSNGRSNVSSSMSQLSNTATASDVSSSIQNQLKLTQAQNHEVSNSDYMELEIEVEKISYHLETLSRAWSKVSKARANCLRDPNPNSTNILRFSLEFTSILNDLNSNVLVKELEQSLFKLNWLITSKSGFSEPNWQSTVLSLTPSTIDSFIGVNLLKNYYRYVKYDFVSYKLFTRQLQLIQICAIILHLISSILSFYKEMTGGYVESARIENANMGGLLADSNQALCSFNFSADKFRPISWSANHVTLYNIQVYLILEKKPCYFLTDFFLKCLIFTTKNKVRKNVPILLFTIILGRLTVSQL